MTDAFERREHSLENQFFFHADQELLTRIRAKQEEAEGPERLARGTGIRDPEVIRELLDSGISPETLVALSLVPLVFVAWADGSMEAAERKAILQAAREDGVEEDSASLHLLEHWLERKPEDPLLEAWRHYIRELETFLEPDEIDDLRSAITDRTKRVAEAAGGFLGIGSVTKSQLSMIAHIESAFVNPPPESQ